MARLTALWAWLLPGLALAQESPAPVPTEPPVDSTIHRHLGFYFHVDVGGAFFLTEGPHGEFASAAAGGGALISIAGGRAVAEDWILAGEIWGVVVPSSTVSTTSSTVTLGGLGVNVTHYFTPVNIFLTLTPSATVVAGDGGSGTSGRTQVGFGTRIALGKEWWVSEHWGLGVALQGFLAINRDPGTAASTRWTMGGGILFSTTYN